jgi:hypothetical protein
MKELCQKREDVNSRSNEKKGILMALNSIFPVEEFLTLRKIIASLA